jgi:nucleotide-binding universal stress UspA family protein
VIQYLFLNFLDGATQITYIFPTGSLNENGAREKRPGKLFPWPRLVAPYLSGVYAMMPAVKKILYATDLSRNSAHALRYALYLSKQNRADIHLLHVVEEVPPHALAFFGGYVDDVYIEENVSSAKNEIKRRLENFFDSELEDEPELADRVTSVEVSKGYPADEILKRAESTGCDMIVMGTHGRGLSRAFLGSVAEKVLRKSPVPVCIIPLPKGERSAT